MQRQWITQDKLLSNFNWNFTVYPTHLIHNKSEMIELIEILVVSGVSFFEQDFVNSNLIYFTFKFPVGYSKLVLLTTDYFFVYQCLLWLGCQPVTL